MAFSAEQAAELEPVKKLGQGAFGLVLLVKSGQEKYALKIIDLSKISSEKEAKYCLAEAKLFEKALNHENLMRYLYSFITGENLYILTEYCPNGDLAEFLEAQRDESETLDEARVVEWFRQIASALQFLHSKKIIHRDLKANNIFFTAKWDTKLGDLGIARILDAPTDMASTQCGTPSYMSPEIFMGLPYKDKSDIWALGVVVFEMSTLERPFDSFFMPGLIYKIVHGGLPDMPRGFSKEFTELLAKMMCKDPDGRPSADDIMGHALFRTAKKPQPLPPKKSDGDEDEEEDDDLTEEVGTIMDHLSTSFNDDTMREGDGAVGGVTDDDFTLEKTLASGDHMTADASHVMQHVIRSLTGMGHTLADTKGARDQQGLLKQQIELLKMYCLQCLDDNDDLFKRASVLLDKSHDDNTLEESLMQLIGHEKFGLCGVQLLYYKNFTFNLRALK